MCRYSKCSNTKLVDNYEKHSILNNCNEYFSLNYKAIHHSWGGGSCAERHFFLILDLLGGRILNYVS